MWKASLHFMIERSKWIRGYGVCSMAQVYVFEGAAQRVRQAEREKREDVVRRAIPTPW